MPADALTLLDAIRDRLLRWRQASTTWVENVPELALGLVLASGNNVARTVVRVAMVNPHVRAIPAAPDSPPVRLL
jgi:hypothetical protein